MVKNSYKKKYLSLFYLTFVVLLGIVCLIVILISNLNIHSYIKRKNESVNTAITSTLNCTMREIERTVLQISQFEYVDILISTKQISELNLFAAKDFILKSSQLRSFNSTIASIELFCTANDIIVSNSVYSLEELQQLDDAQYAYYSDLKENCKNYYTPKTQTRLKADSDLNRQYLTTICYFERYGNGFFILLNTDPSSLVESLKESFSNDIRFAIYKEDAEVVGTISNAAQFASYAASPSSSARKVTYLDNKYYLLSSALKYADMNYIWLMPTTDWLGSGHALHITIYLLLILLALIASYYISHFLVSKVYQPIDELSRYVKDVRESESGSSSNDRYRFNEFAFIKNAFESFRAEITHAQAEISEFLPLIRTNLLCELTETNPNTHIQEQLSKYNITFPHSYFRIVLLQYDPLQGDEDIVTAEHIYMAIMTLQKMESDAAADICAKVFEQHDQKICIIFNYENPALYHDDYFSQNGIVMRKELHKICDCPITISIGQAVESISELPVSCKSAQNVLDNRYAFGRGNMLSYNCINKNDDKNHSYLKTQGQEIVEAIRQCDTEATLALINQTKEILVALGDWKVIQINTVSLIFSIISSFTKNDHIEDFFLEATYKAFSWEKILSMDINELMQHFEKIALSLVSYIQCNLNEKRGKLVADSQAYIEQHYFENISIVDIADSVGVSAGHLSRIFKSVSGATVIDYLTNYRIEQAKLLLADENIKIKEIAERVGYYQPQSFMRVFKAKVGQTPGQYRETLLKNHSSQ